MKRRVLLLVMFCLEATSLGARGLQFRLQGERLTLRAEGAPLTAVLKEFSRAGVEVRLDPRVQSLVTGSCDDADLQQALKELLDPFGYVLLWDVIDGPLGPLPKLGEIRVFLPGEPEKAEPLRGVSGNFVVTRGPTGSGPAYVTDEVLLAFKAGTRRDEFEVLLAQLGGTVLASIPELGIYHVRLPPGTNIPALLEQLANNPLIARAEPNYAADAPAPVLVKASGAGEMSLRPPDLKTAPVALLDSGLLQGSGLSNIVVGAYDALNPDRALDDKLGHGTQMALILSGSVTPGGERVGGDVPVVAVRAFDDNGFASSYGLMRSVVYALEKGARVINMSWGTEASSEFIAAAVRYAQSKGAVVVASAGNEPTGRAQYPAALPGVVAVSAMGTDGRIWSQSNYGDFVTVAAPGQALFPVGYNGPPGTYAGTSIASAYVSRALGQYFAAHPGATVQQALAALKASVTDTGVEGKDAKYGYGVLDTAALSRLLAR